MQVIFYLLFFIRFILRFEFSFTGVFMNKCIILNIFNGSMWNFCFLYIPNDSSALQYAMHVKNCSQSKNSHIFFSMDNVKKCIFYSFSLFGKNIKMKSFQINAIKVFASLLNLHVMCYALNSSLFIPSNILNRIFLNFLIILIKTHFERVRISIIIFLWLNLNKICITYKRNDCADRIELKYSWAFYHKQTY